MLYFDLSIVHFWIGGAHRRDFLGWKPALGWKDALIGIEIGEFREPNSKIWIDKKQIKVSSDGFFAFGIDRDRKFDIVITKESKGKTLSNFVCFQPMEKLA